MLKIDSRLRNLTIIVGLAIGLMALSYYVGFWRGCRKVVGPWESAHITNELVRDYCYGERNLWQDEIQKRTDVND